MSLLHLPQGAIWSFEERCSSHRLVALTAVIISPLIFGLKVGVKKVDGVNYMQDINYDLVCEPNTHSWALKLKLTGNPISFDNAAVQTNINGLGIKILRDGQPFVLGSEITITPTSKPHLKAVPVQQVGIVLTEGAFEATATLQADYQ
ncbi:putative minor fimbrial subunit StfF [Serratia fonticola]|uniref:Putative minor fimbrial subunit StfF n=1 Tax=Serratia fonticola TaxID=47917 RepID=A0A4U9VYT4_SERFO|nr:putative minor fimbrial subunit StfF [Serratia fonticola]